MWAKVVLGLPVLATSSVQLELAVGGDLDPVANIDGEAAVAGGDAPGEVDPGVPAGCGHEVPGGAGHVDGGIVDQPVLHAISKPCRLIQTECSYSIPAESAVLTNQRHATIACGGFGIPLKLFYLALEKRYPAPV